jgi:UDP-glucose 4-epimerase
VTGVSGRLGQRLLARLQADDGVSEIIGLDHKAPVAGASKLRFHLADLGVDDLKQIFEDGGALVHAAWDVGTPHRSDDAEKASVERTRRVLEAAGSAGVELVIVISSAAVYGAWADNAVPLTEDATLRPNPGAGFAVAHAEVERVVAEWQADHPSARSVILRPTVTLSPGGADWVTLALAGGERRSQYVHADDVAGAVATVLANADASGVYNVAADGWVTEDVARDLLAIGPVALPLGASRRLNRMTFATGLSTAPPAYAPYRQHAWVVANDKLKALGWQAEYTNEEALVVAGIDSWWGRLSAKRRQVLVLGSSGITAAGAVAGALGLVRRRGRRRA